MHIGIDARFLGASSSYGLAQYSENLLLALSRLDSQNQFTVFVSSGLSRKLRVGENFDVVPVHGRPLSAEGLLRLRLKIRQRRLDLLHVHFPLAPIGMNFPTLITVHDVVPFSAVGDQDKRPHFWDRIGGRFLYPMTMRKARWILCVSNATRDRLVDIFPDTFHKSIVLPSGVEDLYRRRVEPATAELIRSRIGVPGSYILYSGSAGESKNIPVMVQAFALLRQRDPRARRLQFLLDITGDPKGLGPIRLMIEQYELDSQVRILTGVTPDEQHVLFDNAQLLFIASKEEGFGFPVLKAQLSHVPVVAADAGALPEVCGEGGLLVDPDDVEQMVEMLDQALFDPELREYLKDKGEQNATRYSWNDTAKRVKEIYELLF